MHVRPSGRPLILPRHRDSLALRYIALRPSLGSSFRCIFVAKRALEITLPILLKGDVKKGGSFW